MSAFSRMHDEHLTPPEGCDPHPWSEELYIILEDAGLSDEQIHHACSLFDRALEADPVVEVTIDDLFTQASMCQEFDSSGAIYWRNRTGSTESVRGSSYAEVLCKVINTLRGDELTPEADQVSEYLCDILGDDAFEKVDDVLRRVKRIHLYSPPAIDIGKLRELVEEWRRKSRQKALVSYTGSTLDRCAEELAALIGDGGEAK